MKTRRSLHLGLIPIVLMGALGLVSCGSSSIPTATELTTVSTPASSAGGVKGQVFAGINRFRQSQGKPAFQRDRNLENMAQHHAEEMLKSQKMSHDGYHLRLGAAETYFGIGMLRENVYWSQGRSKSELASAMVNGWTTSPKHRRNLLANNKTCGIGIATDSAGNVYAAQLSGIPINRGGQF